MNIHIIFRELQKAKEEVKLTKTKLSEIEAVNSDLVSLQKDSESSKHKMKMKIDYLTNKCFQLSCKIDKNDMTPEKKNQINIEMLIELLKKKQIEFSDNE